MNALEQGGEQTAQEHRVGDIGAFGCRDVQPAVTDSLIRCFEVERPSLSQNDPSGKPIGVTRFDNQISHWRKVGDVVAWVVFQ